MSVLQKSHAAVSCKILLYFLMSGQMSDVGTCTLCDSSTPSTCQAWIGTWPCCLDTLKSNENPHFSAIRVSWSQHCRVWHVQIHPITTARLSVNFKHRHLDENITGSVWCDPLNGCEVLWWFFNDFWLEVFSLWTCSCYWHNDSKILLTLSAQAFVACGILEAHRLFVGK